MTQRFYVHPENPQLRLVRQAAQMLRDGAVIAYPTDSSYALGCHLGDADALRRLRQLRGVDDKHHLTLVCADLSELGKYARVDNRAFRLLKLATPGPYTFILEGTREVPKRLLHPKRATLGLRVPDHPVVQALLTELGEPILSATLIPPDEDVALNDPEAIAERMPASLGLILDAGQSPELATTVVDLTGDAPEVLRVGNGPLDRIGLG
ncbi:L-threonylcarbamoyladenylate synthase [Casimicrobium huifangae]|uniref:L-threonylcarbamoyladenylate synthase n=1 Tax=Casimicrobium huifangae TaxID=2591109 RepID=UPI0012EBAC67|nr:L-threonylcarbamoyladenylate synthase [Casimicrobium huifangae]HOB02898.1 L-threonylcarbamoyladenylate synthase [Casimicrobium huifangae]